jgi:hypothetical protein
VARSRVTQGAPNPSRRHLRFLHPLLRPRRRWSLEQPEEDTNEGVGGVSSFVRLTSVGMGFGCGIEVGSGGSGGGSGGDRLVLACIGLQAAGRRAQRSYARGPSGGLGSCAGVLGDARRRAWFSVTGLVLGDGLDIRWHILAVGPVSEGWAAGIRLWAWPRALGDVRFGGVEFGAGGVKIRRCWYWCWSWVGSVLLRSSGKVGPVSTADRI